MMSTIRFQLIPHLLVFLLSFAGFSATFADTDPQAVALGKLIFQDTNLSTPTGQACASCHQSDFGHADKGKTVSPGADPSLFGNRNAPSITYIKFNPDLFWNKEEELWMGGFFWDGRDKTLFDQIRGPFLNPLEMANASEADVINKIKASNYAGLLEALHGKSIWENETKAFSAIQSAVVAYLSGPEFAPFSSKYDAFLAGTVKLTKLEQQGLELFEAENKGNCAACHPSQKLEDGSAPLFTDYSYDNLGTPVNPNLPFLRMAKTINPAGKNYRDEGLKLNPHINNAEAEIGKFKVPSLRNIALTPPYMHNGVFETLEEVVDFYNTRDTDPKWPAAEIAAGVNTEELGDLQLSDGEVKALVAFMKTLSDGFKPTR